jgi:cysteine desulfuration protein SufE
MSTIQERANSIAEELSFLDRDERFEWIIDTGKALAVEDSFTDEDLVKGCQSKVWLKVWQEADQLRLSGTSDALLVKGIVSLLLELYNGSTTSDARAFDFIQWLNENQISLSMQRMQGLEGMLRRIQSKA